MKKIQAFVRTCITFALLLALLITPMPFLGGAAAYTPVATGVGAVVRTWGSEFAISSAEEWQRARNPVSEATVVISDIIIDNSVGFWADPTLPPAYQRDERGALRLAPGVLTATYESVPFAVADFTHLINSFGADTPEGTWIEVWARAGRSASANCLEDVQWLQVGNLTAAAVFVNELLANPHSAANVEAGFLSSGRWSPFSQDFQQGIRRTSSTAFVSGGAQQSFGSLIVSGAPANVVQYRITLHRDSYLLDSPVVRNIHSTTRNTQIDRQEQPKEFPAMEFPARNFNGQSFPGGNTDRFPTVQSIFDYLASRPIDMDRQGWFRGTGDNSVVISPGAGSGIYMQGFPMRSQQATGPILGGVNCSAVTIGMIVNGFLNMEGILPHRPMEEIGLNLFDYQLNGFGNWQFSVAGAGTYGLRAHVEYTERHDNSEIIMETILRHLMSGHALGLSLRFSSDPTQPHFLPRTDGTTAGHLIVLLGVVQRSGNWYIISYEPWAGASASANDRVYREFPIEFLANAIRYTGTTATNGSGSILYVVRPGVEPGAGWAAPVRLNSYLIQVAPGEFALSTDGTVGGRISIAGMDRGNIGGPSGFVAYTTDPAFNFMGTTIVDPHGQGGTKFRYMPIGDTIRFGYDAHISPVQPFTYAELTNPNFRMYIMMGNGFTHVIDASRVPALADLYPELVSPGGQFRVNNPLRTVAPNSESIFVGETLIGTLRTGLEASLGGQFAIFDSATVIGSVADFLAATPKADNELLGYGDFIVVVNASQTLFIRFELDYFGLAFANSGVGDIVRLDFFAVTRPESPNFYPWSNPLTGWNGAGQIIYTAEQVGGAATVVPPDATDLELRNTTTTGLGAMPMRFVEADPAYPGGFRLVPYSTTGTIMPWRGGLVRVTATIHADDPSDPFNNESRSFYIQVLGGGPGANGGTMFLGYYTTGHLTPSFTWGTFAAPVAGERTYNLTFSNTEVLDRPVINVPDRPESPIDFPYTPYANDRPHWTWNTTWDNTAYNNATTHTRVNWFRQTGDGRLPVELDENHGYVFQYDEVYVAELFLATAMHPTNTTWMNVPAAGAAFNTFVANIANLPSPGQDGIASIEFLRSTNWVFQAVITFERLPERVITPGPCGNYPCDCPDPGDPGPCGNYPCDCPDLGDPGPCGYYPCECEEVAAGPWTVTFNLNGGSYAGDQALLTQTVADGASATTLSANPTRAGFSFTGWSPTLDLTDVTADRTFTAQWQPIGGGFIPLPPPAAPVTPPETEQAPPEEEIEEEEIPLAPVSYRFHDVNSGHWFFDYVMSVYNEGLMLGTGEPTFSPNAELTRAMIVTILWREAGSPVIADAMAFDDVASGDRWYADAIRWAAANGIVNGFGDGTFRPNESVTREHLSLIKYRYASFAGISLDPVRDRIDFEDGTAISGYAANAVASLSAAGIVQGRADGTFNPQGTATRAEVAAMLVRLLL